MGIWKDDMHRNESVICVLLIYRKLSKVMTFFGCKNKVGLIKAISTS